jgi:thiamine biosynthesis protein ThiI
MGLLLLRYGEIALKGHNKGFFYDRLRQNVRQCLRANGIAGEVRQSGQRIYVETDQVQAATEAVRRVFGVVWVSPVEEVPPQLDAISSQAASLAWREGLAAGHSFRVDARRADKSFDLTSPEIERAVGAAVVEATGARVDLSHPTDLQIGVEVHPGRALVFGRTLSGPGGLPVGTQGRVVALLSNGIDSPVAAWLMMKRGCSVVPVHFFTGEAQQEQVQAIVDALNRYAYGSPLRPILLSHEELLAPTLARLKAIGAERWACVLCKRAMLAKATEIAQETGALAIATGDSLGQVASQTLSNLEAISYGIPKPILRPLIGLDKTEIMAMARSIGTYAISTGSAHVCPYLPDRPLTRADLPRLRAVLAELAEEEATEIGPERPAAPRAGVESHA